MDNQAQENNQNAEADCDLSTIYHYCSLDSFTKIVSSSTIRLYDVCKSNDSLEAKWITRAFCSYMQRYLHQIKAIPPKLYNKCAFLVDENNEAFVQLPQEEKDKLRQLSKKIQSNKAITEDSYTKQADMIKTLVDLYLILGESLAHGAYLYVWVFCLSAYGDSLGQWRGYGDDGYGISIGFKKSYFSKLNDSGCTEKWPYLLGLSKAKYLDSIEECKEVLGFQKLEEAISIGDLSDIYTAVQLGLKRPMNYYPFSSILLLLKNLSGVFFYYLPTLRVL